MAANTWRCFVAVPLDSAVRAVLATSVEGWRARADVAGFRWSAPDGWHVTLAFIGDTHPDAVPALAARLATTVARHAPFRVETEGFGAFPDARRARVAWLGVADPDGDLRGLAADVAEACGLTAAGPYRAHVTLARARGGPIDARAWIADAAQGAPRQAVDVRRVELLRSHLGRGPARYETLATVALAGVEG